MANELSVNGYKAVSIYSCVLFLLGLLTQIVTLRVLCLPQYRKRVMTPYFMNIAISNAFFLFGSLPTTFLSSTMQGKLFVEAPQLCRFVGLLSGCGAIAMIITMSCATVKLYFLSKSQINASQSTILETPQYKAVIGIWVYTVMLMLPPTTGLTSFKIEGAGTHCVPNWTPGSSPETVYVVALTVLAYVIPVVVAVVFLVKIHNDFLKQEFIDNELLNLCFSTLRGIYKMSVMAVVLFTITWLPYALLVVVSISTGKKAFSVEIELWPTLFAKISAVFNPYIYAFINPSFRRLVVNYIFCKTTSTVSVNKRSKVENNSRYHDNYKISASVDQPTGMLALPSHDNFAISHTIELKEISSG